MMVLDIRLLVGALLVCMSFGAFAQVDEAEVENIDELKAPLYEPFIERYILDEIKSLRQGQQAMKAEVAEKVATAKLESSDRALRYTADTTNNIFYIITAAASMLVLLGWKSLRDIRDNVESITEKRVETLTEEYAKRLSVIEEALKERSEQIVAAQQDISNSTIIHSLWMRAGLEKTEQEKINIYDQILEINPNDVEALTYKADTLLDIDQDSWALSLTNQAIECDSEYAMAYWQKACAEAKLELYSEAIGDIQKALDLSRTLQDELLTESYFESLKERDDFKALTAV
ncbi:tetratricopeptide repeat protein [Marinomonas sp. C2222]|uniref:Tetratricopeptide repeat protein n=1 Tax=Marinomonas sargassi TaxID=2984494 RepID=A0ABT2YMY8_9GAMM|nr:tetratricopeptide repeat protein [Marinomonas sargassi]MCV2401263.1 tetratricopeptide repeat protein [Marinomonas sargassi]